jgi:uncharacterized protein YecT (DUF1311 family)
MSGNLQAASDYEEPECMSKVQEEEDINICQFATAKYFELRVKEVEEEIMNRFKGVQLERFRSAQSAWRAMLENDCAIQSDFFEGANVYTAIISQCLQTHYRNRLDTLENYLCPEHSYLNGCDISTSQSTNP